MAADMLNDGNIRAWFVPTIANTAAPTVAELTAGTALECLITADGLDPTTDEGVTTIPKLCETFDAEAPGRTKFGLSLTLVRKDVPAADIGWNTLLRGTAGFMVFRYGVLVATAWTAAQLVQVFPGKFGERRPQKPEANGATKFMTKFYIGSQPNLGAIVA